jgi:hypothetical protein
MKTRKEKELLERRRADQFPFVCYEYMSIPSI